MNILLRRADWRGEFKRRVSMASLTSWRVGGVAERFYRPADNEDLCRFLRQLPDEEPLLWVGLGSNLLVRDGGVAGTVIALHGCLAGLERIDIRTIRAGAGVPGAKLARFAAQLGLAGGGFLAGIPGTIGGALVVDAGAYGEATWNRIARVQVIDCDRQLSWRLPQEFEIKYRKVHARENDVIGFVAAEFVFDLGRSSVELLAGIRDLLARRTSSQPTGSASCGSVFRNPPGDYAGRLIEVSGLKGLRIGGAVVSEKHANFILNTGGATAADIEILIQEVRQRVCIQTGVVLEPEVHIVGIPEAGQ